MKPHSDRGRIYLNFPGLGEEGEELVRRSFGATSSGSREVKRKYDPRQHLPLQSEHQARLIARRPCGERAAERAYASNTHGFLRASIRSLIGPVVSKETRSATLECSSKVAVSQHLSARIKHSATVERC